MKLIIVIDRDNDIGRKAGVSSPVIGREACLRAAEKLGLADPEDSDLNTIYGALKIYDELRDKEDVEVVIVAGDENVGIVSDSKISDQIDFLKRTTNADSVILVTDGSEDEFVIPIVASRFKIDGVKRIIVKQSKTIESTFYLIKKMLEDPKIAKSTLTPIGVLLIIYSVFSMVGFSTWGYGFLVFIVGLYFILKAYGMENVIEEYFSNIKKSLYEGRLSFITYIIALIFVIVGIIQGVNGFWRLLNDAVAPSPLVLLIAFIYSSLWWLIFAGVSIIIGKAFDAFIERKSITRYFTMVFLLLAAGLILWGGSVFILSMTTEAYSHLRENALSYFLMALFGGFLSGFIGVIPYRLK